MRREIQRRPPKRKIAISEVSRILEPQEMRSVSSARQKAVEARLWVEVWGPLLIAALMASSDQGFLTAAGKPEVARYCRSGVAG